jgi:TATA-box binding protein (TBP) (component of TFIID and TFIIIB)
MSKRFDDGSLATVTLGTEIEEETDNPDALSELVYRTTMDDLKALVGKSELDKIVATSIKKQIDRSKKVEEAEKQLKKSKKGK